MTGPDAETPAERAGQTTVPAEPSQPSGPAGRLRRTDAGLLVAIAALVAAALLPSIFGGTPGPLLASKATATATRALEAAYTDGYQTIGAHPTPDSVAAAFVGLGASTVPKH